MGFFCISSLILLCERGEGYSMSLKYTKNAIRNGEDEISFDTPIN